MQHLWKSSVPSTNHQNEMQTGFAALTLTYMSLAAAATGRVMPPSPAASSARRMSFCWCFRGKAVGYFPCTMEGACMERCPSLLHHTCNCRCLLAAWHRCRPSCHIMHGDKHSAKEGHSYQITPSQSPCGDVADSSSGYGCFMLAVSTSSSVQEELL